MKVILLCLTCLIYLSSCVSNIQEKERLGHYNNALLSFSSDQVSHFPHDLSSFTQWGFITFYPGSTKYNNKAGLFFIALADSSFFRKTVKSLESKGFTNFPIYSDSLMLIGDTLKDYSSLTKGYPVPSFIDIKDEFGVSSSRLNDRETIFIIEAKAGNFLEKNDNIKGLKLPEKWGHGYSRGITADFIENKLIYWLVIW